MARCVENIATGFLRHYQISGDPPYDPVTERLINVEEGGFEAAKPPSQIAFEAVPKEVSPLQAKIALHRAGFLTSVEAAIAAAGEEALIAYRNALVFRRDSPMLLAIAAAVPGLADALDDVFTVAATIEV